MEIYNSSVKKNPDSFIFTKMNGAGNDFIIIDKSLNENFNISAEKIRQICDRRKGIGADGILLMKENDKLNFELEYYNSDGSLGSLCGNGSRCAINYFYEFKKKLSKVNFFCGTEIYSGEHLKKDSIKFCLKNPKNLQLNIPIKLGSKIILGNFIDTGSPHVVIFSSELNIKKRKDFNLFDIEKIGREIRYSEQFGLSGTNVNFLYILNNKIYIRTYERGVEAETLACGTGSVASSIITYYNKKINPPLTLITFGNDKLVVDFSAKKGVINKISLTGPAKINYIGNYFFKN